MLLLPRLPVLLLISIVTCKTIFHDQNQLFRTAYNESTTDYSTEYSSSILLNHELTFFHKNTIRKYPIWNETVHELKSIAHIPLSIFLDENNEIVKVQELLHLQRHINENPDLWSTLSKYNPRYIALDIIQQSLSFIAGSQKEKTRFLQSLSSQMMQLVEVTASILIRNLDIAVKSIRDEFYFGEMDGLLNDLLNVLVVTGHMDSRGHWSLSYFDQIMHFGSGCGISTKCSSRKYYTTTKHVDSYEGMIHIFNIHHVDERIGNVVFGEGSRLHSDVLERGSEMAVDELIKEGTARKCPIH